MARQPEQTPQDPLATLLAFTPVPREKDRSNGWKPQVQRDFIAALAETGSVRSACRRVGRSDHGAYALRRHPQAGEFRAAWDTALDLGVRRIEDGAMERALNGVEEIYHYHGDIKATRRRYNERLVMFMLRNRAPHRFAAGGGARALNAVGRMELDRLRKQWRAEWEAEQEASAPSPAEIRASIERKVAALKARVLARSSPASYELRLAESAQMRSDEAAGWRPGLPYAEFADRAAELLPRYLAEVRAEWPSYQEAHPADHDDEAKNEESDRPTPRLPAPTDAVLPEDEAEPEDESDGEPRVRSLKDGGW